MSTHSTPFSRFLGCDVSKHTVTFYDSLTKKVQTVANTRSDLSGFLRPYGLDCLAVCEPTGNHEGLLLEVALNRVSIHRTDTMKVKCFIRSYGTLGKTDELDARALAHYGEERWKSLVLWSPPDEKRMELRSLIRRREELVAMQTAEKNRRQAPGVRKVLQQTFTRMLKAIQKELDRIDQEIKTLLDSSHELQQTVHIMTSLSGIGELTATKLLALLPEIGQLPRKQITALAGLAPHPKDSGTYRGYRRIRGGRKEIKRILFLSAISAAHHETKFQDYYQRQLLKGKSKKSILAAIMAKIVITLNARIRDFFLEKQLAFQQS